MTTIRQTKERPTGYCAVCLRMYGVETPGEFHHVRRLATSKKRINAPGYFLCTTHHRGSMGIHSGRETWEKMFGPELSYLPESE